MMKFIKFVNYIGRKMIVFIIYDCTWTRGNNIL